MLIYCPDDYILWGFHRPTSRVSFSTSSAPIVGSTPSCLSLARTAMASISAGANDSCISAMILPLCVALGVLNFDSLWQIQRNVGDRLYFERQKSAYLEMIEKEHANQGKRLMVFPGGGWSGVAGRVYVFDESDEILLDEKHRSADFQRRMDATELSCNAVAFPLEGHFYKAFITC